jgi:hypothetical protein
MGVERRCYMSEINVRGKSFQAGVYADGSLGDTYVSRKACEIVDSICPEGGSLAEEFDIANVYPYNGVEDILEIALNTLNDYTDLPGFWEFVEGDLVLSNLNEEI